MKTNRVPYSPIQMVSALCMVLALLWLTISAPFVVAGQKLMAKYEKTCTHDFGTAGDNEGVANPFGNNTEEKSPSSSSFSEEYLHDHHKPDHIFSIISPYHNSMNTDTYVAFHGELLVPPPNRA